MTTIAVRPPAELCEAMRRIDFTPIINTLTTDMGFTTADAYDKLGAFIQWFSCIPSVAPDGVYVMLKVPVDDVFHACILDTAFYRELCREIIGEFLDHKPIDTQKMTIEVLDKGLLGTIELLETTFGADLHPALADWRRLFETNAQVYSCVSCGPPPTPGQGNRIATRVIYRLKAARFFA